MDNDRRSWTTSILLAGLLTLGLAGCADDDEGATTTTTSASETTSTGSTSTTTTTTSTTTTGSTSSSTESTTTTSESTTTESTSPEPTITIDFLCGNGETGSTGVATDDIEQIDDVVNTIDLCEFRGGIIEISFTAPCPSGDREVTVATTDGAVPDIATLDLCENP